MHINHTTTGEACCVPANTDPKLLTRPDRFSEHHSEAGTIQSSKVYSAYLAAVASTTALTNGRISWLCIRHCVPPLMLLSWSGLCTAARLHHSARLQQRKVHLYGFPIFCYIQIIGSQWIIFVPGFHCFYQLCLHFIVITVTRAAVADRVVNLHAVAGLSIHSLHMWPLRLALLPQSHKALLPGCQPQHKIQQHAGQAIKTLQASLQQVCMLLLSTDSTHLHVLPIFFPPPCTWPGCCCSFCCC